jgi:hypothetical protein
MKGEESEKVENPLIPAQLSFALPPPTHLQELPDWGGAGHSLWPAPPSPKHLLERCGLQSSHTSPGAAGPGGGRGMTPAQTPPREVWTPIASSHISRSCRAGGGHGVPVAGHPPPAQTPPREVCNALRAFQPAFRHNNHSDVPCILAWIATLGPLVAPESRFACGPASGVPLRV